MPSRAAPASRTVTGETRPSLDFNPNPQPLPKAPPSSSVTQGVIAIFRQASQWKWAYYCNVFEKGQKNIKHVFWVGRGVDGIEKKMLPILYNNHCIILFVRRKRKKKGLIVCRFGLIHCTTVAMVWDLCSTGTPGTDPRLTGGQDPTIQICVRTNVLSIIASFIHTSCGRFWQPRGFTRKRYPPETAEHPSLWIFFSKTWTCDWLYAELLSR